MGFRKSFPRTVAGSNHPLWEEVELSEEEEKETEQLCRRENFRLLDESILDARTLAIKHGLNTEENVALLAIALFEKQASHRVFWKESKAREKFEKKISGI